LEGTIPGPEIVAAALDAYLIGDPYYLSRNQDMGLVFINPTYTINDLQPLVEQTNRIEDRAKAIAAAHGARAGLTGITVVGRDEMVTSEQGFAVSMAVALVLILVLMILVFRIPGTPLIIGIPLILGIYWTAGVTGFLIRRLNILTAMYLVALVGLGVDYAIHPMTGFVQERDAGKAFPDAIAAAFAKSGRGIVTGALTTAAAFFAMLLAQSDIVRELALVAGSGILCELAAMLILIPALLGLRQRRWDRTARTDPMLTRKTRIRSDFMGVLGRRVAGRPVAFAAALLAIGLVLAVFAPGVELEDNLMNMEAKGLESVELQDLMVEEFGAAPDMLYLIVEEHERDGLPRMVGELEDLDSVKFAEAITDWWPTDDQIAERGPWLERIRDAAPGTGDTGGSGGPDPELVLEELYRLEANLVEMGDLAILGGTDRAAFALNRITGLDDDGNRVEESVFDRLFAVLEADPTDDGTTAALSAYQERFSPLLARRVAGMADAAPLLPEELPPMTRDAFLSREGNASLVTISPRQNPWEGRYRNVFTAQVNSVTDRGTGMILAADQLTNIAEKDSVRSLIAALSAVFLILLADFRNLRLTGITFLPLGLSFASLYGLMAVFGIKFDFVNIIAIPLLVGIGIDYAVHINHRYLVEGRGRMDLALARTGTAVALTTITTMIGFSSFIPSIMRAMRSTGIVLTLAMALAFIYSILFHPAVLVLSAERLGWNLSPRIGVKERKK
jgi:predicted RND superfamily exporter protein